MSTDSEIMTRLSNSFESGCRVLDRYFINRPNLNIVAGFIWLLDNLNKQLGCCHWCCCLGNRVWRPRCPISKQTGISSDHRCRQHLSAPTLSYYNIMATRSYIGRLLCHTSSKRIILNVSCLTSSMVLQDTLPFITGKTEPLYQS